MMGKLLDLLCPACRPVVERKTIITARDVCARCWEVLNK